MLFYVNISYRGESSKEKEREREMRAWMHADKRIIGN